MPRDPFDMQKACFSLIAVLVIGATAVLILVAAGCGYMVLSGRAEPGICIKIGITDQLREMFSEVLTAVLALLLAARSGPPPPPPGNDRQPPQQ